MPSDPDRPSQAGPSTSSLVGRDREQALLQRHLTLLQSGRGSFLLISGEAGIGKTTLVEAFAQDAVATEVAVYSGQCFDLSTSPPYGPWIDLLDNLETADSTQALSSILRDPQQFRHLDSQIALFSQVWRSLTAIAARQPVVLILEDVHWADLASLDLLRFIARQVASQAIMILVTYRVDELTRQHPLSQLLPAFVRECQAVRVDLKRLDLDTLREIVRMRYQLAPVDESRLAGYLYQHSEGNPFYFNELLRSLVEEATLSLSAGGWRLGDLAEMPIPPLVLQVIQTRLERLSDNATRLLSIAAILGQQASLDIWSSVSQASDEELADAVEQAIEAHLLVEVPGGSRLRFTHALVREALYRGMVLPRRRAWHRRAAEVLASRRKPDPEPIAFHFQQADDPRAAEWLIHVGEKAFLRYAPQAAIDHFTAALDLQNVLDPPQQLTCYRARGLAYETIGEFARAQADFELALDLAGNDLDQHAEWQTLLNLGMLWASRDYTRTEEYYQRALQLARDIANPPAIARSLNRLGNWHMNIDQPAVAQRYHREALTTFRGLNDHRGTAETLDFLGATLSLSGDLQQTAACYEEAIALFRELDDRQGLSSALATSSERGGALAPGALIPATTLARSQIDAEAAIEIAREIGWRAGEVYALFEAGLILSARGEFGRALETLQDARRIASEIEHRQWLSIAHVFLGDVYHTIHASPQAREHCELGIALGREVRSVLVERLAALCLVLSLIEDGELADATRQLDAISDAATDAEPIRFTEIFGQLARAELELARQHPDTALRVVDQLLVRIPNASPDRMPVWPAIIRGETLTVLRRWDEAEADLRAAIRDAIEQGAQPLLLRAHMALGALYQMQARVAAAERQSAEAGVIIDRLAGTIPDDELGVTFRRRTARFVSAPQPGAPGSSPRHALTLSKREIEVLRFVAEGLTDADVAEQLSISRRTVTSHLTSIYNKLGVSTRTAAVHLATTRKLI